MLLGKSGEQYVLNPLAFDNFKIDTINTFWTNYEITDNWEHGLCWSGSH
jgi:hypothetical protein